MIRIFTTWIDSENVVHNFSWKAETEAECCLLLAEYMSDLAEREGIEFVTCLGMSIGSPDDDEYEHPDIVGLDIRVKTLMKKEV